MLLNEGLSFLMSEEEDLEQNNLHNRQLRKEETRTQPKDEPIDESHLKIQKNQAMEVTRINENVVNFERGNEMMIGSVPFNFGSFVNTENNDSLNISFGTQVKMEQNDNNLFKSGYSISFPNYSFDEDYLEKEEKILRPKKRRRKGEVKVIKEPDDIEGDLMKNKDSLIFMDSISFDKFIQKLSKKKSFTSEEKELVKDLRRKIKNRESARKSRMNKKSKVEDLEKKVKKLHDSTTYLSEYVAVLKNENKQLKEEIVYLMNLIQKNPIFSKLFQEYLLNPQNEEFFNKLNSQSLFLMALIYSLGLITNVESYPDTISQLKTIYNNEGTNCRNEYIKESDNYFKNEEDSGSSIEAF